LDLLKSSRADEKRKRDVNTASRHAISDGGDAAEHTKGTNGDLDLLETSRAGKKRKRDANTVGGLDHSDVEDTAKDGAHAHTSSATKHKKRKKTKHKNTNDVQDAYGADKASGPASAAVASHETEGTV
jgi:hypothetical protein